MRRAKGITSVELMISVGVLGILAAIAAPSFTGLLADSARTTAVNDLFHALFFARSESMKRGAMVTVCKSPDGLACVRQGDWTVGWMVFANHDGDEPATRDPNEPVLAVYPGWSRGRITSNRPAYSFRPHTQGVINGTIVFCDTRGSEHARAIIISHTGRPRVSKTDSSNRPLRC